MTKTEGQKQTSNAILKKGKIKRKQMFTELQTVNEQRIQQKANSLLNKDEQNAYQKIQQQDSGIIEQKDPKFGQKSIQQVCQAVNRLMAKNKIGIKNAFQVPIIDLLDVISYNKDQTQNSWKTLSATLQNDYKIYGYRVDAIHSITYSILNIMSRRQNTVQQSQKNPQIMNKNSRDLSNSSFFDLKQSFIDNIDTSKNFLQKDPESINISSVDKTLSSDPILERTKRLFDQPGLKGMLTNSIGLNKNLQLPLYSKKINQKYCMKISNGKQHQVSIIQNPLKVFESVEKINHDLRKILKLQEVHTTSNKQLQRIWTSIKNKNFNDWNEPQKVWLDVQDPQNRQDYQMMMDQNSENQAIYQNTSNIKYIGDYIKIRNPPKKIITDEQLMLDGQRWLNQIDKKFLGIKTNSKVQLPIKLKQKNIDDILFDQQILQRNQILRKQVPTKQINEDIQDKFLTPIRPMNQFKIQKILTLREQPQIQLQAIQEQIAQQNQYQNFLQKQIDVKRQTTSIKQMKQSLSKQIFRSNHATFNQTYQNYCHKQSQISPALCFLTLLHLANQNNLSFQTTQNQMDFFIKIQSDTKILEQNIC